MNPDETQTLLLLRRWHGGDREALGALIERDLPWIRDFVRRRLGAGLRSRSETGDIVQRAMVHVLEYGPRFLLSDQCHFRALVARIVENVLRVEHRALHRRKRDVDREQRLATVLDLDASMTSPSQAAERSEERAWLDLGMELLDPDDREVLVLRQWNALQFQEIGDRLRTTGDAARMHFQRALARLAKIMARVRTGELAAILAEQGG